MERRDSTTEAPRWASPSLPAPHDYHHAEQEQVGYEQHERAMAPPHPLQHQQYSLPAYYTHQHAPPPPLSHNATGQHSQSAPATLLHLPPAPTPFYHPTAAQGHPHHPLPQPPPMSAYDWNAPLPPIRLQPPHPSRSTDYPVFAPPLHHPHHPIPYYPHHYPSHPHHPHPHSHAPPPPPAPASIAGSVSVSSRDAEYELERPPWASTSAATVVFAGEREQFEDSVAALRSLAQAGPRVSSRQGYAEEEEEEEEDEEEEAGEEDYRDEGVTSGGRRGSKPSSGVRGKGKTAGAGSARGKASRSLQVQVQALANENMQEREKEGQGKGKTYASSDSESAVTGEGGEKVKKRKRRRKATEEPRDAANRKFICQTCKKLFARPSALATHERSHSKEKPHLCPFPACRRPFAVPSNLRRHQRVYNHHDPAQATGAGGKASPSTVSVTTSASTSAPASTEGSPHLASEVEKHPLPLPMPVMDANGALKGEQERGLATVELPPRMETVGVGHEG